jgi:TetR/AcrR family transcriptional regulator, transcriptional repressor for nem operon
MKMGGSVSERGKGRERIVSAARELFWQNGFEGTSPRDILNRSEQGQGSLYHHFEGKLALGNHVLVTVSQEEISELERIASSSLGPVDQIKAYLSLPRHGLRGCKLGRFVYETTIENAEIRNPILSYFTKLEEFLLSNLRIAQGTKMIGPDVDVHAFCWMIMSCVQGAHILARAHEDVTIIEKSMQNLAFLLDNLK